MPWKMEMCCTHLGSSPKHPLFLSVRCSHLVFSCCSAPVRLKLLALKIIHILRCVIGSFSSLTIHSQICFVWASPHRFFLCTSLFPLSLTLISLSLCTLFSNSLSPSLKALFFKLSSSSGVAVDPGCVIGEAFHYPGGDSALHKEVDVFCYIVSRDMNVTFFPLWFMICIKRALVMVSNGQQFNIWDRLLICS